MEKTFLISETFGAVSCWRRRWEFNRTQFLPFLGSDDDVIGIPRWLDRTSAEYKASYGCLSSYLSHWPNATQTTAAILADITALSLAFDAYVTSDGRSLRPLPAMGLTIDQTFFASYALAHCGGNDKNMPR